MSELPCGVRGSRTPEAAVSGTAELSSHGGGVRAMLAADLPPKSVGLAWLGQAGFALRFGEQVLLIDPYLSDSLARKYRGTEFPHERMMPPPLDASEFRDVNAVLCTHRHGDHMDPDALPVIAARNPHCRFLVPRAERESAKAIGLPAAMTATIDAGETVSLTPNVHVTAVASAHEKVTRNDLGEHHFLGYILRLGGLAIYHSGDCVPYEGLVERLREQTIHLAMLPANGRDEYRRSRGVPGNMTLEEAGQLCHAAGIGWLVPHHFGMFAFNSVDRKELTETIKTIPASVQTALPQIEAWFEIRESTSERDT